jgi:thymidylate synthase
MKKYKDIINQVLVEGVHKQDRTGTGTISTFGIQKEFDLAYGFPIVTGKFTPFKTIANELLWFISGSTNNEDLRKLNGNTADTIWEEWARPDGSLGPVYGKQWRHWDNQDYVLGYGMANYPIDQLDKVIQTLRQNPDDRGMIVSAWNVADLPNMALRPCHYSFEFWTCYASLEQRMTRYLQQNPMASRVDYVDKSRAEMIRLFDANGIPTRVLSCKVNQRSCDLFLGVPFNIASYALLTHLIGHVVNMLPGTLIWSGGDVHIYKNHLAQIYDYLKQPTFELPELYINEQCPQDIDNIRLQDFSLIRYNSGPVISAPVSK